MTDWARDPMGFKLMKVSRLIPVLSFQLMYLSI